MVQKSSAPQSSVIHALVRGAPTPDFPQTDGIAREAWRLPVEGGRVVAEGSPGAETLRLNLWDFGGQEIYRATHTYFLTLRAVYVIVTTARRDADGDASLEEWLETAQTFGKGAPVWVVVNKHDENPNGGPDEAELLRKFGPMLRGFLRTQCQHGKKGPEKGKGAGRGIEELKRTLVEEAWAMPEVRREMSAAELDIKEHLEGMKEPTLSLADYRKLCAEKGISGEGLQTTLLGLWDKLGTVRYFPEAEDAPDVFRDTAILHPDWVTEAVYRVLEDAGLKKAHGLVKPTDLERIVHGLKHPAGSWRLIEQVMRRFSQLYDTRDGRMFIPHLLEDREPAMDWPREVLRFVYRYPVLPAGLVPAFIAQMARDHDPKVPPWRKGCVLSVRGCRVRVIGDRKARTVTVEVAPQGNADARDALEHIRSNLEDMHKVFAAPEKIEELMPVPGYPDAPLVSYRMLRALERDGEEFYRVPVDVEASSTVKIRVADALGGVRTQARAAREKNEDEHRGGKPHGGDVHIHNYGDGAVVTHHVRSQTGANSAAPVPKRWWQEW